MTELRCTMLTDGSSDRALLPLLRWLFQQALPRRPIQLDWADLRSLPTVPKKLAGRMRTAVALYPCDMLVVHRDAEGEPRHKRVDEIHAAAHEIALPIPVVSAVTVRMQEAWLLIDEQALRQAAGNPNGGIPLPLPKLRELEGLSDPKEVLHHLLRTASELQGRRLKKFDAHTSALRVADFIDDWTILRKLAAFVQFEADLQAAIQRMTIE